MRDPWWGCSNLNAPQYSVPSRGSPLAALRSGEYCQETAQSFDLTLLLFLWLVSEGAAWFEGKRIVIGFYFLQMLLTSKPFRITLSLFGLRQAALRPLEQVDLTMYVDWNNDLSTKNHTQPPLRENSKTQLLKDSFQICMYHNRQKRPSWGNRAEHRYLSWQEKAISPLLKRFVSSTIWNLKKWILIQSYQGKTSRGQTPLPSPFMLEKSMCGS